MESPKTYCTLSDILHCLILFTETFKYDFIALWVKIASIKTLLWDFSFFFFFNYAFLIVSIKSEG